MAPRKQDDSSHGPKEQDPTTEMLEWAEQRIPIVSESTPGRMGPPTKGTKPEPDPPLSTPTSTPGRVGRPERANPSPEPALLVLALHEGTAEWGQAHLLSDGEEANRFIATLIDNGIDPSRIAVLWGAPIDVCVTYRAVVTMEHAGQEAPAES